MLSITSEVGGTVKRSSVTAKMLSFLRGQVRIPDDAGEKLRGCRACTCAALVEPGVAESLTEPAIVVVAADGERSAPVAVADLRRAFVVHALPSGKPLTALEGGPLLFLTGTIKIKNVTALEISEIQPAEAVSTSSSTVRLDHASVQRALQQEAAKAATGAPGLADASTETANEAVSTPLSVPTPPSDKIVADSGVGGFQQLSMWMGVLFLALASALGCAAAASMD